MKEMLSIDNIKERLEGRKPRPVGKYRYFSVLAPLVEKNNELHLLYQVRADSLRRQPGEVSFPGGKMEEDETPGQCAVRETIEEMGVNEDDINVLGQLDYIHTYSNFTMYSFLGTLRAGSWGEHTINKAEVKDTFLVPLSWLFENEPHVYYYEVAPNIGADFPYELIKFKDGYDWRKGKSTVPIYTYGEHVIWGLTARITWNLINILRGRILGE